MSHESKPWQGVNLASARLGALSVYATDDFFAPKERLLQDQEPVFIDGKYDDNGKWMDGWESRRKRSQGFDYCVVKLAFAGKIQAIDIDTRHFTGNFPPAAKLQACFSHELPNDTTYWTDLTDFIALTGDQQHPMMITDAGIYNYVRLNIYPDGGVARLRVYGIPDVNWSNCDADSQIDLLAAELGGRALLCNDEHYGTMHNLNLPGRGVNMGDGWETRRRREPGNDWVIMALAHEGRVERIEIDTAFFKGNFPNACSIQAARMQQLPDVSLSSQSLFWEELLPKQKLSADAQHQFIDEVVSLGPITHIRVNIYPDGGLSRVRLFGRPNLGS